MADVRSLKRTWEHFFIFFFALPFRPLSKGCSENVNRHAQRCAHLRARPGFVTTRRGGWGRGSKKSEGSCKPQTREGESPEVQSETSPASAKREAAGTA